MLQDIESMELVVPTPISNLQRTTVEPQEQLHLALFISGLSVGGVERTMLALAHALAERGHRVDLLVLKASGFFEHAVSPLVNLVNLECWWLRLPLIGWWKRTRALASPPALARYLRRRRPDVLVAASHYVNLAAIWGCRLAGTETPLVIRQCTHLSRAIVNTNFLTGRRPLLGWMVRRYFRDAGAILAVSDGVADDLAAVAALPRCTIRTIYNPVVTSDLLKQASAPIDHPWFSPGAPPVILGVGRLAAQKDFVTLVRAFARVRARRPIRLMILGEGKKRRELEELADSLGVRQDLALPGFEENPFAYMARAAVFALSSAYEGLPGVLIQAMACGCPVVSTDCPSGPREILEHGSYGPLVPVGDDIAMAEAIQTVLDAPPGQDRLRGRAAEFSMDRAVEQYLEVLFELSRKNHAPASTAAAST
jgi:glycosyltransferase involved in cell wall biosynthesis